MMDIYNPNDFTITDLLKQSFSDIRKEYFRWQWLYKKFRYKDSARLRGLKRDATTELENTGSWELLPLMARNKPRRHTQLFFPTAYSLIQRIPVFDAMAFSIYEPGTEIAEHRGWSDNHIRFQLGIDCNDESYLVVNGVPIQQQTGEVIVFNDYQLHWGYNRGTSRRVVLLFDVLKEDLERSRKR
jgi:aspartyl/asparaginyl beta-hydroxylase (cupin superfamily)